MTRHFKSAVDPAPGDVMQLTPSLEDVVNVKNPLVLLSAITTLKPLVDKAPTSKTMSGIPEASSKRNHVMRRVSQNFYGAEFLRRTSLPSRTPLWWVRGRPSYRAGCPGMVDEILRRVRSDWGLNLNHV
jgi:hypothetical protein